MPVVLVTYSDRTWTKTAAQFQSLLFGSGTFSMADYYTENSYGKFTVSAGPSGIAGWYTSASGHDYYGTNDFRGNDRWPGTLVREAVIAMDNAGFNFAPYDQDGDCKVDNMVVVHQGEGEEAGGTGGGTATDIWSHSWDLASAYSYGYSSGGAFTTKSTCAANPAARVVVNKYTIQPETLYGRLQTIGVFAHEFAHALGLPDLYDTTYASEGAGSWSMMASGNWLSQPSGGWPGDRPSHFDAWSKARLAWVSPTFWACTATLTLPQVETGTTGFYQFLSGSAVTGTGQYFLVENRQKVGFDVGLPGAGMLVWHVDESVTTDNDRRCYPGSTPSCATQHYMVALVQADNLWHLDKGTNAGDAGDPYPGTASNTRFDATSSPSSALWSGTASGVAITSVSASGTTMTATAQAPGTGYALATAVSPTGVGSVTVNTPQNCTGGYAPGTAISLTANPPSGYSLATWSGTGGWFSSTAANPTTFTITAAATVTATFTMVSQPTLTSVVPNFGPTTGSTTVTLTGTNFVSGTQVTFGGASASNVTLGGSTSLVATTPARSAGPVDVVVANGGSASATLPISFTYLVPPTPPPTPTSRSFYVLPPCRVVDTRLAAGAFGGPLLPASTVRLFPVTLSSCGIPSDAAAVSLNVTVSNAAAAGYFTLFAASSASAPLASTINFRSGQTRANSAIVPLGWDGSGALKVLNGSAGTVDLVLDVNGYTR